MAAIYRIKLSGDGRPMLVATIGIPLDKVHLSGPCNGCRTKVHSTQPQCSGKADDGRGHDIPCRKAASKLCPVTHRNISYQPSNSADIRGSVSGSISRASLGYGTAETSLGVRKATDRETVSIPNETIVSWAQGTMVLSVATERAAASAGSRSDFTGWGIAEAEEANRHAPVRTRSATPAASTSDILAELSAQDAMGVVEG